MSPDYGAALPPTPHPLADLLGLVTHADRQRRLDRGDDGGRLRLAGADRLSGLPTRNALVRPLDRRRRGGRSSSPGRPSSPTACVAYIDLPYIALCLGALAIETKRPRAGWPVLALLVAGGPAAPRGLAFLLRLPRLPGATTSSATGRDAPVDGDIALPAGLCWRRERSAGELVALAVLALAAPLAWVLFDWVTTGNPLYSLTGTQKTVETLRAPDRAGRPRPLRPAPARRSPPVAGDDRRRSGACARLRLPAPPLGARHRRRAPRPGRLRRPRLRRPGDHRPLHDARRRRCSPIFVALALLGWRLLGARPPLAAALAALRRRSSPRCS